MSVSAELDKITAPLAPLRVMFYVFVIVMTVSTLARFYARIYILRQFGADDFFMIFSLVNVVAIMPTHSLYKKYLWVLETAAARGPDVVKDDNWRRQGKEASKILWTMSMLYPLIMTLFKLSILAFYRRFLPPRPYRVWIYATAVCSVLFSIAASLATVFQCIPVHKAWEPTADQYRRVELLSLFVAVGSFNLVTDVILVAMPLPVVLRLHADWKRKVGLVLLFSLCVFGTVLTAVRLWKTVHLKAMNRRREYGARWVVQVLVLVLLSGCETAIIPLCANMPALAALWRSRGRRPSNNNNNPNGINNRPRCRGQPPPCAFAAAKAPASAAAGDAAVLEKGKGSDGSATACGPTTTISGSGDACAVTPAGGGKVASLGGGGGRRGSGCDEAKGYGPQYGDDSITVSAWELEANESEGSEGRAEKGLSAPPPPPPPPAYAHETFPAAATAAAVEPAAATTVATAMLGCEDGGRCSCGLVTESSGDERSFSLSGSSSVEEITVAYRAGEV